MKPYAGPRSFRSNSLESLGEKLDRAFNEVDRISREATGGVSRRWAFEGPVRGSEAPARTVIAKPNIVIECDTEDASASSPGPTVIVTLPPVNTKDVGLECGILRMHTTGTITLLPFDGAKLDGDTAPQTIPTACGLYVLVITSRGYFLRR